MHRHGRRYILILVIAIFSGGCKRVPDNARYIPADAVAVAGINLKSLSNKIAWNLVTGSKLFKEIQKRMPEKNAGTAVKGIENAGFDVRNTFYVYSRPDNRFSGGNLVAGILPLADAALWQAYIAGVFPDVAILERNGRKEASLGEGMYVGWDSKVLIIIKAMPAEGGADEGDADNSLEVSAEMEKAFMVPATNSMTANKRYTAFEEHGYDLSFWLNYGSLISDYTEEMSVQMNGVSLSTTAWNDAILTAGIDFKNGKIAGDINYCLPSQVRNATSDFGVVATDKELLDRLPGKGIDMLLSLHISPQGVKSLLEKAGLLGLTNVTLTAAGLDVDYVLDAFTGDMAVLMSDFSLKTEMQEDFFMGQMVAHKKQRFGMTMTYAVGINKQENFKKLLEFAEVTGIKKTGNGYIMPLTTHDSVFMMLNNKYAVVSNKRDYATGILDGRYKAGKMPDKIAKRIYGYPFGLCMDISQLFREVDPAISSSPGDSAIIAESKKLLDNISLYGGKYSDDAYKFKLEINFLNKDENSILELVDFGMRMNYIRNNNPM